MKNFFTTLLLITTVSASIFCQPPQAFKYQAVIRDSNGDVVANQAVGIEINIRDGGYLGTIVYQEIHNAVTNNFGLVNLEIGNGTPTGMGTFGSISWGLNSKFLEILVDPSGGTSYVSVGTSELLAVPYSILSDRSRLVSNEGTGNLCAGDSVAKMNTTGHSNTYVGYQSGYNNTEGYVNSFFGFQSGYNNTTGAGNTFMGNVAGLHNTTGSLNTIIGDRSGLENTEGTSNTYLGYKSGHQNTIGTGNVCLGYKAGYYNTGSNRLYIDNSTSTTPRIYGEFDNNIGGINGLLGIGTNSPTNNLVVKSSGYTSGMYVLASDNDRIFRIRQMSAGGGGIYTFDGSDNATILLNGEGNSWIMSGNVGIGTTTPASRLDVQGNVTIRDISTGDIAIELGKGLDYAEGFDVSDEVMAESGTVLCIDENNPGELKISDKPYDKTVAGIVAGANGLGSGVRLGTKTFDCDVALAGRVYCNTVATTEDINPGDMLTTSSVPGYAMKVTDLQNAKGAILGKAMEKLEKGKKGQILVLVTLQ